MDPGVAGLQNDFVAVRILVHRLCLYAVLTPGSLCVFAVDGIYNLAGTACHIRQLSIYIFIMIIGKLENQILYYYYLFGIGLPMLLPIHLSLVSLCLAVIRICQVSAKL